MVNKMWMKEIMYWLNVLQLPIYWLSFLMPRNRRIWVYGSTFGKRFADNPKYFYLYMNQLKKDKIRSIWITKDKKVLELLRFNNYEAYYCKSIKGMWYCLRAKVYLYDNYSKDISFVLSGGAKKINLWHGIPLKKINMDNKFDLVRHPRNNWEKFRWFLRRISDEKPSHYVLTTSEFLVPIFSSAFITKNVLVSGYPRNDFIISNLIKNIYTKREEEFLNKIENFLNSSNGKVVFYMPTFRESEIKFFDLMDMIEFNKFLVSNNILFCVKLHPKSKLNSKFELLSTNRLVVIEPNIDPYIFLKHTDVLVTDYSSIYFDYLLLHKPIVFFNYDMEDYLSYSREMYFTYDEYTPGLKAKTMKELMDILSLLVAKNDDGCQEERNKIRILLLDNKKEIYSEALYEDLCKILDI